MTRHLTLAITDHRAVTPQLRWLTLAAPELSRSIRAGQYLLLRCGDAEAAAPALRRPLFLAAAQPTLGQIALLYAPDDDAGLRWLARAQPGDIVDAIGPLGRPFALDSRSRTLLLLGEGQGIAPLLPLAADVLSRGGSVTLLATAASAALLPPAFLLPEAIEYESAVGDPLALLRAGDSRGRMLWADQLCAALAAEQIAPLRDLVRAAKLRWDRRFAAMLPHSRALCGVGACGLCPIATRDGVKLACSDGPVFDLRDLE